MEENLSISVDVNRALNILSGHVFTTPHACIRELIANASDSLINMPPNKQAHAEVRIVSNHSDGILKISDNGKGMTRKEVKEMLGKLFSSSKEENANAIGRFGVGFYSCFPICQKVEVLTKSTRNAEAGIHVIYNGGQTLNVTSCDIGKHGTTVIMHLLNEHMVLLDEERLQELVKKECNFIEVPVYIGNGWNIANQCSAPWYNSTASEDEIKTSLKQLYGIDNPLVIFPIIFEQGTIKVQGLFYIHNKNDRQSVRLFSNRILITETEQSLLDETLAKFISGIIDVEGIPLVLSRDAIIKGSEQSFLLEEIIIKQIAIGMEMLGEKRQSDFLQVMASYGQVIKSAGLKHQVLLDAIKNYIPYHTSLGTTVSIPAYLEGKNDNIVIFADDMTIGASLIPLYNHANIAVIYMTDRADEQLRDNWWVDGAKIEFIRLDVNPPSISGQDDSSINVSTTISQSLIESMKILFQSATDETLHLELRDLGHQAPPSLLAISEEDRDILVFTESLQTQEGKRRLKEMPSELQQMAEHGFLDILPTITKKTIILNRSNTIVEQLIFMLQQSDATKNYLQIDLMLAKFLYGQAFLASGINLSPPKINQFTQDLTQLLTTLLSHTTKKEK